LNGWVIPPRKEKDQPKLVFFFAVVRTGDDRYRWKDSPTGYNITLAYILKRLFERMVRYAGAGN
jgi:hypothetical protein